MNPFSSDSPFAQSTQWIQEVCLTVLSSCVSLAPGFILGVIFSGGLLVLAVYRHKRKFSEIDGTFWESAPYEVRAAYRHWCRLADDWLATPEGAEIERRTRP